MNGRAKAAPGLRIGAVEQRNLVSERSAAEAMARSLGIAILGAPVAVKREVSTEELVAALEAAWSGKTSYYRDWTPGNPAYGQCAVTALVVQDHLGGELEMQRITPGDLHFWNRLPDGSKLDLTERQFTLAPAVRDPQVATVMRQRVLAYPDTAARYQLLKAEVGRRLLELTPPALEPPAA